MVGLTLELGVDLNRNIHLTLCCYVYKPVNVFHVCSVNKLTLHYVLFVYNYVSLHTRTVQSCTMHHCLFLFYHTFNENG